MHSGFQINPSLNYDILLQFLHLYWTNIDLNIKTTLTLHWVNIGFMLRKLPPPLPRRTDISEDDIFDIVSMAAHIGLICKTTLGQNHLQTIGWCNLLRWNNIGPAMSCYLGYYLDIFIFDKYNWSMIIKMCAYRKNTSITTTKRN